VAPSDERVALVDERGRVVGEAPRSRMRRENLRHSSTGVIVRRSDGAVYVHRRADDKDWAPSAYDAAAGGVIRVGEEPRESARRELAEELGVTGVELRPLLEELYEDETVRVYAHVFEVTYDGVVTHADGEVAAGWWLTMDELAEALRDPARPFVPDTQHLLRRLAETGVGDYGLLRGSA
jgi:8-oxo-dGTP pyrophosphatase MutT (NUDIX family)